MTSHLDLDDGCNLSQLSTLALPVVIDTLKRVHRAFHVSWSAFHTNCYTFLVDPEGFLRFHLIHALSQSGMNTLRAIVEEKRRLMKPLQEKKTVRPGVVVPWSLRGLTGPAAKITAQWEIR